MAHYYPRLITNVGSQISQFMPDCPFSWSPSPYSHNPLHSIATQGNTQCGSHLVCDKYILKNPKKLPFHMKKKCNGFQIIDKNPNKISSTHTSSESCCLHDNRNNKTRKDLMIDWNSNIPQGLPCFRHPNIQHKDKVEQNCNETKNIKLKKNYRGKNKCTCGLPPQVLLQPYPVIFPVCCSYCQLCMHNINKELKSEFHAIPQMFHPFGLENSESLAFTKLGHKNSSKNSSRSKCSIQTATPRHYIDIQGNVREYLSGNQKTAASLFFKHDSSNCYKSLKRHTSVSECVNQSSETLKYPKSKSGTKKKNYIRKSGSSHTSVRSTMSLELPSRHSRLDSLNDFCNELSDVFQMDDIPKETFENKEEKLLTEKMSLNYGRSIHISSEALDKFAMDLLSDKFEINKTSDDNISRIPPPKGISSCTDVTNFTNECSTFHSSKNGDGNKNILYGNNNTSHEGNFNYSTSSKATCKNLEFNGCSLNTLHENDIFKGKGNQIFSARSSEFAEPMLDDISFNCLKSDVYSSSSSSSMTDVKTNISDAKTVHIHAVQSIIRRIEQDNFREIYESIMNPLVKPQPSEKYENTTGLVLNLEPNLLKDSEVKINDEERI